MDESIRRRAINDYIQKDPFAAHLGAKVEIIEPGYSRVSLTITEEMTNFHGITHGGVILALNDIAFAAAGNSHGQMAVGLNVSLNYLKVTKVGDQLVAVAKEEHVSGRTALYDIKVYNTQTGELVAKSQNLIYRKNEWFVKGEKE